MAAAADGEIDLSDDEYDDPPLRQAMNVIQDETVTIPCEFCEQQIPLNDFIVHETKCNPVVTCYGPDDLAYNAAVDEEIYNDELINLNSNIEVRDSVEDTSAPINDLTTASNHQNNDSVVNEGQAHFGARKSNFTEELDATIYNLMKSEAFQTSNIAGTTNQDTKRNASTVPKSKSPTPSTFAKSLQESDHTIFKLNQSDTLKLSKNKQASNSKKSVSVEDIEESLFRSFVKDADKYLEDCKRESCIEEVEFSSDDDADETIEQFWERAQKILKKRLMSNRNQVRENNGRNFYKEKTNYGETSAY